MFRRLLYKSFLLAAVLFSASLLVAAVLFTTSQVSRAQTSAGSSLELLASVYASPSHESPQPMPPLQSDGGASESSEPGVEGQSLQPSAFPEPAFATAGPWPKYWYSTVGAVFQPANSGYSYQYGNSGCLKSNSPGYWRADVHLPDGAVAKYLYLNYYNGMYAKNSTAYLTKYKYNGDYADLASVSSRNYTTTGITGYFMDLSREITETINNQQFGYTFIWSGSTTQRLCSVRVGYYPPSAIGLPVVLR